jgi:HSP20 family protein
MSLLDPFADLTRLRQQIDRLMQDEGRQARPQASESVRVWRPAADLFEDQDALTLLVDLPGAVRDSLDVQLTGDELVVRGERKWHTPEGSACVHQERPHGQFQRVFRIGVPLQHDAVEAGFRDGVLTVRLPKAETVKPRKVAVKSESEG